MCVGDLDGDGATKADDFSHFASMFGTAVRPWTRPDYDGDGYVPIKDFHEWLNNFGCTP